MPLPPVLYEDEALIAWDKPSGLSIAPDRWDKEAGQSDGVRSARGWAGRWPMSIGSMPRPSGVLLCAKTKPALDYLSGLFQAKQVERSTLAPWRSSFPPERAMKVIPPLVRSPEGGGLPAEFAIDLAARPGREPSRAAPAPSASGAGKPSHD